MTRREQREQAFLLIYQNLFNEDISKEELTIWDYEENEFTTALVNGVSDTKEELDEEIEKFLKGWTIKRLSSVSLAVLRMAVYEMKYLKTPASVVINEAVELTKNYSLAPDPSFVNGVLSSVEKSL